jgi:hypothetical protein
MFAVIAAILFGLALILNIAKQTLGPLGVQALLLAGLLFLALHFAVPFGGRPFRGRRPGPG